MHKCQILEMEDSYKWKDASKNNNYSENVRLAAGLESKEQEI
jgi:hypothetical protein